jgi:hypothetical protein
MMDLDRDPDTGWLLYGLSVEEARRRFDFSQRRPNEVYGHAGPWVLHLIMLPDDDPDYEELWSWCGYCDGLTHGVGYMALDDSGLWLCNACATWAGVKHPSTLRGASIIGDPTDWERWRGGWR